MKPEWFSIRAEQQTQAPSESLRRLRPGLTITHRVVTRHHRGSLQVESRPGRTRFRARLPIGGG